MVREILAVQSVLLPRELVSPEVGLEGAGLMVRVYDLAHCRAGDKGNTSNISVVAYNEAGWRVLREQLTPERVLAAFAISPRDRCGATSFPTCARSISSSRTRWAAASRARCARTCTARA